MDLCYVLMLQIFELVHKGDVLIRALIISYVIFLMIEYVLVRWVFESVNVEFVEVAVFGGLEELYPIQEIFVLIRGKGVTHHYF